MRAGPETQIAFRTAQSGSRHILVEARLGGRGPFILVLDTGFVAPFTVALSPEAAARAGARPAGGAPFISRAAVGNPVRLDRHSLAQLSLGPVRTGAVTAGVTDAVGIVTRAFGTRIDGLIGHDFLTGRVLTVDYPCRTVDLEAASPAAPASAAFTVAPVRPVILVTARINGRGPYHLVLDTGAGHTILAPGAAAQAGVEARGNLTLIGAGGPEAGASSGRAQIALGSAPARAVGVLVAPLVDRVAREAGMRIDGIAGTNLFAHGRLTLDYRTRRMWLEPARACRA